jgi:hypothetical protein
MNAKQDYSPGSQFSNGLSLLAFLARGDAFVVV